MNKSEIRAIERTLKGLGGQRTKIYILEWGSGGSTLYFTEFLKKNNIAYEWVSIEYNKDWFEKVKDMTAHDPNIEVMLFNVGNDQLKQREVPMDEYVRYPSTLNKKFDMILVDGRKRRRCVLESRDLLTPEGVVFLHDAQRTYYHCAFSVYPDRKFVNMFLWCGKNRIPTTSQKLSNVLSTLYHRGMYFIFIAPFQALKRKLLPWRKNRAKARARRITAKN